MSIKALNWAFAQDLKNTNQKFVLVALADSADDYGICWPSYNTIAKKCSIGRSTAIRAVKELEANGLISKNARYKAQGQNSNAFQLKIGVKIEDDHPLKDLVSERHHPQCHSDTTPVSERHPPSVTVTPKSTIEPLKEKNTLTREEFLRFIDGSYQDGAFQEWEHLTETEIKYEAEACLDFYGAKGEWPAGNPTYVLRHWIRGGVKKGKIRAKPKEEARQEAQEARFANPLQDWHKRIEPHFSKNVFNTYIRPLEWDGNGTIRAPRQFHADYVRTHYYSEITQATHNGVEIIHQPKPEETQHHDA